MKESRGMKTTIVNLREYKSDEVGLLTQAVLTELLIIFSIIIILSDKFMPAFYAIISMLMFNMAYNNKRFFKKKYMTSIYIILGFFVAISTIVEYCF